jgi:hypothetical protein
VKNLTPQLVNAGTIKMTYPENRAAEENFENLRKQYAAGVQSIRYGITVSRWGPEYQVRVTVICWSPEYQVRVTVCRLLPKYQEKVSRQDQE